jgi:hypothetical protein
MDSHNGRYILNAEGQPVPEPDLLKWARWLEVPGHTRVALTKVGKTIISTAFLGVDHNLAGTPVGAPPILWETMVFVDDDPRGEQIYRYTSREEAIENHWKVVAKTGSSWGAKLECDTTQTKN